MKVLTRTDQVAAADRFAIGENVRLLAADGVADVIILDADYDAGTFTVAAADRLIENLPAYRLAAA